MILTQSNRSCWRKTRQSPAIVHRVCQPSAGPWSDKHQPAQRGTAFLTAVSLLLRTSWQTRRDPRINMGKKTSFNYATHRWTCFGSSCRQNTVVPPSFFGICETHTLFGYMKWDLDLYTQECSNQKTVLGIPAQKHMSNTTFTTVVQKKQ